MLQSFILSLSCSLLYSTWPENCWNFYCKVKSLEPSEWFSEGLTFCATLLRIFCYIHLLKSSLLSAPSSLHPNASLLIASYQLCWRRMTQQDILWSLLVDVDIFMCSRHKLIYELLEGIRCNIPATVHKSISDHLAAGLAGRRAETAEFSYHAIIQAAVCGAL